VCRSGTSSANRRERLTLAANVRNHSHVGLSVLRIVGWVAAEDWRADCPFQSGWIARAGDGWPAGRPRSGNASVAVMEAADLRDGVIRPRSEGSTARGWGLLLSSDWCGRVVL
jgi:hypothetical protein